MLHSDPFHRVALACGRPTRVMRAIGEVLRTIIWAR